MCQNEHHIFRYLNRLMVGELFIASYRRFVDHQRRLRSLTDDGRAPSETPKWETTQTMETAESITGVSGLQSGHF
jgi:hypothetical protein